MKRVQGYTLVEMMVALSIGLVSIGAVSAVLISSSGLYRVSEGRARIQENARFGIGAMQDDVHMAGYMGCFNIDLFPKRFSNLSKDAASFTDDYKTWVSGYEAGASAWTPALDPGIGAGNHAPAVGNDVLVVRLPGGKTVHLTDAMETTSVPIPVSSTEGFVKGGLAIVSDCTYADLFVVGNIAADKKLVHAADDNTSAKLTRLYTAAEGATVTPVTTVSYFLSASSDGVAGNKSLWRQERLNPAEEIADGIERMEIEYGIDTDANPDGIANKFVTADAVGANRVVAIKVSLLVRSSSDRVAMKAQTYNFNGSTNQSAPDKRLYTPFTTTIALRNRVN